jgi:hypothetical protein
MPAPCHGDGIRSADLGSAPTSLMHHTGSSNRDGCRADACRHVLPSEAVIASAKSTSGLARTLRNENVMAQTPSTQSRTDTGGTDQQRTCGKGLAEQSTLPFRLGDVASSVADVLEVHLNALDLNDPHGRTEHAAYVKLAQAYREIAARLRSTADQMASYRDLPMGRHDPKAMSDPKVLQVFEGLLEAKQELMALLQNTAAQERGMLDQIRASIRR